MFRQTIRHKEIIKLSKDMEYRRYSIDELKIEDEDLQILMTMGVVLSGTWLDLLSLKNYLRDRAEFRLIYNTISNNHLRVVKKDEYEEYLEWKNSK